MLPLDDPPPVEFNIVDDEYDEANCNISNNSDNNEKDANTIVSALIGENSDNANGFEIVTKDWTLIHFELVSGSVIRLQNSRKECVHCSPS